MNEKLNGIFSYLDIDDKTGLASENNVESLSAFQKLFYEQARSKIGVDAVYFLRDEEGVAKIPLIYFSMLEDDNTAKAAQLHRLSWNMGEAPLLFIVTPTELKMLIRSIKVAINEHLIIKKSLCIICSLILCQLRLPIINKENINMNIVIKCDCGNKITIPAQRVNTLNLEII